MNAAVEIAIIRKSGGPLTKRISLDDAGRVVSDGSACVMLHGTASRLLIADVGALEFRRSTPIG